MEVETQGRENGHLIRVKTDQKIALAVYSNGKERIYLPGNTGSDSTYYNEDPTFLTSTENGYTVLHPENPDSVKVIN